MHVTDAEGLFSYASLNMRSCWLVEVGLAKGNGTSHRIKSSFLLFCL